MKHRKLSPILTASAAAALLALASSPALAQSTTSAGTTIGAVAVTSSWVVGQGRSLDRIIDGSGLSQPYTSGVTTFDTWAAATTHNVGHPDTNGNLLRMPGVAPMLSFDLGAVHNIDGLAYFEASVRTSLAVPRIKVYADNDSDALNGNTGLLLDSGTLTRPAGWSSSGTPPHVFTFAQAAQTRFLNIELSVTPGTTPSVGEVVFRGSTVSAVPEPGTYALMLAGLGAVGFMARRRRSA